MRGFLAAFRLALRCIEARRFLDEWGMLANSRPHRKEFLRKFYDENAHLRT